MLDDEEVREFLKWLDEQYYQGSTAKRNDLHGAHLYADEIFELIKTWQKEKGEKDA